MQYATGWQPAPAQWNNAFRLFIHTEHTNWSLSTKGGQPQLWNHIRQAVARAATVHKMILYSLCRQWRHLDSKYRIDFGLVPLSIDHSTAMIRKAVAFDPHLAHNAMYHSLNRQTAKPSKQNYCSSCAPDILHPMISGIIKGVERINCLWTQ